MLVDGEEIDFEVWKNQLKRNGACDVGSCYQ
jgi:hypothetical protein